ncbi:type II secretion pathway protein E [Gottschalkia acidurici 9a]|uniref:Type II secretion pathway protein E n=1 Tax=Gottschalkia acidurici (strain ATCC 7906 / DSM 604 / BCRC 14475 / CIP 104303 / KCTC 5404 / NCIMB 10678 / 9a) TaxID=1128398 RepID=K0AYE7_GOTA9|nr:ATPase, T2SS/T4P/T4SS family [Gottschalkia acidurici]AFS77797.1 type II secretion pathway protein E [Gottschalkia acidurici 9a]
MLQRKNRKIGELLLEIGLITNKQLKEALKVQKVVGKKLGEILNDEGMVSEQQIIEVLELQLGIPHMDISKFFISLEATKLIDEVLARRYTLIPISKTETTLVVAMTDPTNIFAIDDIRMSTELNIKPVISTKIHILNAIDQYYGTENAKKALKEFEQKDYMKHLEVLDQEELDEVNNAPVVKLVNSIIGQSVRQKVSDIHIEPFEKYIKIRLRVDGDLQEIMTPSKSVHSAILSRIKIMAKMNIVEKRIPQDGRIEMIIDGRAIDMRVSIIPTIHGEKAVIRILDSESFMLTKKELGFTEENLKKIDNLIKNSNGIILVTGPTGSGKSTTLYTVLRELSDPRRNIITIEEPVEFQIEGINQVNVNPKVGMTFANALRSILRQDPDIIMIGEIRDEETAQIAIRAAITGHLVLSTMHTNDTSSTVARLIDIGIDSYLVSSSLKGVVAQRLVKRICQNCKISYKANMEEKKILSIDEDEDIIIHKGRGCNTCNSTGYKGRIAIHEILIVDSEIKKLIDKNATTDEIREESRKQGMKSLRDSCVQLVLKGITTVEEVIGVAYSLE